MSITYEWEVVGLATKTEGSNVDSVTQVNWIKRGTDADGNIGEFNGTTPLTSIGSDSFTQFSSLTESMVLAWVQAAVSDDTTNINQSIQEQIDLVSDPAADKDLPW